MKWLLVMMAKGGLGALIAASTIRFAFIQPFEPNAVYKAIPSFCTSIYQADSLLELLESPVSGQIDDAIGHVGALIEFSQKNQWVKRLTPSEITVAGLPQRHLHERKPWAATSWIGWRSPWIRWKLAATRAEGLTSMEKYAAWPVWKYSGHKLPSGMTLTFSITDSLFIACLSDNPEDIHLLLDTYDKRWPAVATTKRNEP